MDALDECLIAYSIPSHREEVLELVGELVALHLSNLHKCVTSRHEHDIRAVLEPLTPHSVSLHDESGQRQDIVNCVTSFVRSDRKARRWREEDKEQAIKTLSRKRTGCKRVAICL
jgi:hypothetical protein